MPQIKYRAACDHCSATKIKCTQERPTCARCRALGKDCHYSRSLRSGKPPRSSQGLNRRISNTPVLPRHDVSTDMNIVKPEQTWMPSAPYPTPPAAAGPDVFQFNEMHMSDRRSSSISPATHPGWYMGFEHAPHCISNLTIPSAHAEIHHATPTSQCQSIEHEPKTQAHTPPDYTASFDDFICMPPPTPASSGGSPTEGDKCLRITTETLHSLCEMPTSQMDSTGTRRPSVDQALSTTARAVQAMHDVAICQCAKDYYLPLIIATCLAKILAWYQAIAHISDPANDLPESKNCTKEVVVDGPLALGAYQLDDSTGRRLKNQIVLGQLQKLLEIVDRFDPIHCEGTDNDGSRLYGVVEEYMRSRLQYSIAELESRLR